MTYYLGIDSGGSKTAFMLADRQGDICAQTVGPATYYMQTGIDKMAAIMADGVAHCLTQAKVSRQDIVLFIGCAGYTDVPADDLLIDAGLAAVFSDLEYYVGNDTENALAGALGGEPGINVVAGTGAIALGRNAAGESRRCGGWHPLLGGDEGSGVWFGQQLIHTFTRQSDGRVARTLLYEATKNHLSLREDQEISTLLLADWSLERTRIAALFPFIEELARAGDPHALSWFTAGAAELVLLARTLKQQLNLPAGTLTSGTGGIYKSGELILTPFKTGLAEAGLTYVEPLLPPDRGAVLLAMRHGGLPITAEIKQNLAVPA